MSDKLQFVDIGWQDDKLKFVGHQIKVLDPGTRSKVYNRSKVNK